MQREIGPWRTLGQVALWVTIPVTIASVVNSCLQSERLRALWVASAPRSKEHDPATCPACSDKRITIRGFKGRFEIGDPSERVTVIDPGHLPPGFKPGPGGGPLPDPNPKPSPEPSASPSTAPLK